MEECDSPQGFQIMVNSHDGFSGIGAVAVERLAEDYPKKAQLVFGISPPAREVYYLDYIDLFDILFIDELENRPY
jgi:hypothetical protein